MAAKMVHLRDSVPGLQKWGFAVHHFENYICTDRTLRCLDVAFISFLNPKYGPATHVIGDEKFEITTACIDIVHYGQEHTLLTSPQGIEIYNVYMDLQNHPLPPLPPEFSAALPLLFPLHPSMRNLLNRQVRVPIADPEPFNMMLNRWQHEEYVPRPGSEHIARASLQIFLVECCRLILDAGYEFGSPRETSRIPWLERVRRILDEKFSEPQSLTNLARLAGVTPQYLSREFRRYSGKPLVVYLNQRRIESAMFRLRTTQDKIVAIAMECGFQDLSHFNRVFRQMTSTTPSAYRNSLGT